VALQAQQIDVAHAQHVRVGSAVRNVAGRAAFDLHGLVLEDKRSLFVSVAGEANRVLCGRRAHLLRSRRAVRIVAIGALHQAFVHPMVKGHFELRFLLQMAGVAKLWLLLGQQEVFGGRVVRRMTGNAAHIVLRVQRVDGVHVRCATGVASHAAGIDLRGRGALELENLGFVTAAVDVGLAWTVAGLAAMPLRAFLSIEGGDKVGRRLEVFDKALTRHVCVAGLAGFFADVERGITGLLVGFLVGLAFGWNISGIAVCDGRSLRGVRLLRQTPTSGAQERESQERHTKIKACSFFRVSGR